MLKKRFIETQANHCRKNEQFRSIAGIALLFTGALLIVSSLLYLLYNLDKSDSLIVILLPIIVAGIAFLFISQLILPGGLWPRRRTKSSRKFKNQ